jgi:carboxymethylenebutenolidase
MRRGNVRRAAAGLLGRLGIGIGIGLALGGLPALAAAPALELASVTVDGQPVPIEIARPAGPGPHPPLLYIHARRGFQDEDRAHLRELAAQGFLVVAPDWQARQMLERWPVAHDPATEADVAAALAALQARPDVCAMPVGIVAISRGPYYAIRLAAAQPQAVAAIVAYYGHFQDPNAPEPQQLYSVAPEVGRIRAPVLMLIGDADFELRRIVGGRAFYMLWERGVPVELQTYPLARRAFDFRADATPEEKVATRHARQRTRDWLQRHMGLAPAPGEGGTLRCPPGR